MAGVTSNSGYVNGHDSATNTTSAYSLEVTSMFNQPIDYSDTLIGSATQWPTSHAGTDSGIISVCYVATGSSAINNPYGLLFFVTKYGQIKLISKTTVAQGTSTVSGVIFDTQYLKGDNLFIAVVRTYTAGSTTAYFVDSSGNVTSKTFSMPAATNGYYNSSRRRMISQITGTHTYRWAYATYTNKLYVLSIDALNKTITVLTYDIPNLNGILAIGGNRILFNNSSNGLTIFDISTSGSIATTIANAGTYNNDFLTYNPSNARFYLCGLTSTVSNMVRYELLDSGTSLANATSIGISAFYDKIYEAGDSKLTIVNGSDFSVLDIFTLSKKTTQFSYSINTSGLANGASGGSYTIVNIIGGTYKKNLFLIDLNTLNIVRYIETPGANIHRSTPFAVSNKTYMLTTPLHDGDSSTADVNARIGLVSYDVNVYKVIGGIKK